MARTRQAVPEEAREEFIIDTDFHLHMPTSKLFPYIDDPVARETLEDRGTPPFRGSNLTASYTKKSLTEERWDRAHGVAVNREEIREVMDEYALNNVVVQPGTSLELVRSNYPVLTNALVRAYNDYLVDRVIDAESGIYATLFVPDWDVELAVEELDRLGSEAGFVGAQNWITTDTLLGDIDHDPLFDKLTALELPFVVHISPGATGFGPNLMRESMRAFVERMVGEMGYAVMANAMNMIMTGVFDVYPDLDVVLSEAGTGWIPYAAYRADDLYQNYSEDLKLAERLHGRGERYLERMPSEYLFDHFYVTTQPISLTSAKRSHVEPLLEVCRAGEMFVYSSDWPHIVLDPPNWVFDLPGIDDDLRSKILHENAERALRLPG